LNTTLFVKDFKGNDPLFVSYLLRTVDFGAHSDKSSVPGVNRNHLHTVMVDLPPLPEQRAIAAILGDLDDKIELNRRMNATLEELARATFHAWFEEFEPVRAKAKGHAPQSADAATAARFPDAFEDSAIGEVPRGWMVKPLPAAIEINPLRSLSQGAIVPYLEMSNLPAHSARVLGWESREFSSGMKFVNGDTLVARITPCLENGKTAFVDFLNDNQVGWGSTEYIVLHSKPPLPPEYAYFLARSSDFRSHAIQNMTGTSGRQRVPVQCFDSYLIVVPPAQITERFGQIAALTVSTMKRHDDESRTLAAIRDALLPKLLSGEIRVRDAEQYVEVG